MNRTFIIIKLFLLITAPFVSLQIETALGKEKIIWPYVCFKPLYICKEGELADGCGFHVLNLMQTHLPTYEHELLQMPIKRVLESAKNGEKLLFYGLYKTPERESFLQYSLPCRISTPTYLVIRSEDQSKFGFEKPISLKSLLENHTLTFLHMKSISFGKGIDELLETYKDGPNILTEYDTTDMGVKSLKLLIRKRVDYMLSFDGTTYDAKEMRIQDQITLLPIKEKNSYDVGYITAPKNEWGKTIIKQINEVLRKEIPKDAFFNLFAPLVDAGMLAELKEQYNEKILAPSQRCAL